MEHSKYIFRKVQVLHDDRTYFYWYVIGRKSRRGVHFHGCQYHENFDCKSYCPWDGSEHGRSRFRFMSQGIEIHSPSPMYQDHKPLQNCDVTGGDCYCDGTSLMADRQLGFINPDGSDDVIIWNVLQDWFESRFGEEPQHTGERE